jgi:ribokinase
VLVVNEVEFAGMAEHAGFGQTLGVAPPGSTERREVARAILDLGPEAVVVTLGSAGAVAVSAAHVDVVDARGVEVVDTTGAGDGFVGALAAALATGRELAEALSYATAAASLVVQRPGAAASKPSAAEIAGAVVRPISGP